jgi:hypothetical protein
MPVPSISYHTELDPDFLERLFDQLDDDGNGSISLAELRNGLQRIPEFARLAGASDGPMSQIAANLIAQNLQHVFDSDLGDGDGTITFDEFEVLCQQLANNRRQQSHGSHGEPEPTRQSSVGSSSAGHSRGASESPSLTGSFSRAGANGERRASRNPMTILRQAIQPKSAALPKSPQRQGSTGGSSPGSSGWGHWGGQSRADAQLAALQTVLRTEVVAGLEGVLEQAGAMDDQPQLAAACLREGAIVAIEACRRLAGSVDEKQAANSAEARGQAELELLELRRALAEAKVALAEVTGERDELQHTLRVEHSSRLNRIFGAWR